LDTWTPLLYRGVGVLSNPQRLCNGLPVSAPKRERDIERYLVARTKALGGRAYKWAAPGQRGVPDRLLVLPGGRVIAVEVKRPGGRLSRLQERELEHLRGLGLPALVVWSTEDVDALLPLLVQV
jgi:hypothetical protein